MSRPQLSRVVARQVIDHVRREQYVQAVHILLSVSRHLTKKPDILCAVRSHVQEEARRDAFAMNAAELTSVRWYGNYEAVERLAQSVDAVVDSLIKGE